MRTPWYDLSEQEQRTFRIVQAFVEGRLEQRETIDWALTLGPQDKASRLGLLFSVDNMNGAPLTEPWTTAWRTLEEAWDTPPSLDERDSLDGYTLQRRIKSGERSGALITKIVDVVRPYLKVEAHSKLYRKEKKRRSPVRNIDDLFGSSLTSKRLEDPETLDLHNIQDSEFLHSLAMQLDAAVMLGQEIARYSGWSKDGNWWRMGQLNRVYYVSKGERESGNHEPDEFGRGIAPSVKMLHAVVLRLLALDPAAAYELTDRWQISRSEIFRRLWAAMARESINARPEAVASMLRGASEEEFWDLNWYPEFAELRAKRFVDLSLKDQNDILERIRSLPPKRLWHRTVPDDEVIVYRERRAVQELKRISLAGGNLPLRDFIWLELVEQSEVEEGESVLTRIDQGFSRSLRLISNSAPPDRQFDLLVGPSRLKALEASFRTQRLRFDDDPAQRARNWIQLDRNVDLVLTDFETAGKSDSPYPLVLDWFGWIHKPPATASVDEGDEASTGEAKRVLKLFISLPKPVLAGAIAGASHWLSTWDGVISRLPEAVQVWKKLWPLAVEATNLSGLAESPDFETVEAPTQSSEPKSLDTLNSPVGKLVGVFLTTCPNLEQDPFPFNRVGPLRTMRDSIVSSSGRARLIGVYRLMEQLDYFIAADPGWTQLNLIELLQSDGAESIAFWRAIGRRTRFAKALTNIGSEMSIRAADRRLGRETQKSLVTSLVVEILHSLLEARDSQVLKSLVTQMIRSVDDEVRAHAANVLSRFVKDVSTWHFTGGPKHSAEELFDKAIAPFLQNVWPQERSLSTPGISRELCELPSATKGKFADAVDAIQRFLVPFDCWSMIDFGLYGEESGVAKLSEIDSLRKARAFLRLLDLAIGNLEGAVIPSDLGDALAQIAKVGPSLSATSAFRRLSTAARRT